MSTALAPPRTPQLDPALPDLPAALSSSPPGAPAGARCRVRSVEWTPRRTCVVVHEARCASGEVLVWACETTPTGTTARHPVDDRSLPGLAAALDPGLVGPRLAAVAGPVDDVRVTPVSWRPGVRAVVAYDVSVGPVPSRWYVKVLAADGASKYAVASAAVTRAALDRGLPAPVPPVVAQWPELGALVFPAAPGRVLSDLLRDESLPEPVLLGSAEQLGRLLSTVHSTPLEGVARWSTEDELVALDTLLPVAHHADPPAGRALAALVDRLASTTPRDEHLVLAHGAFRTGQVIAAGDTVSLLDLDTVAASAPARDLGNAAAYLHWADLRGVLRPGLGAAFGAASLTTYATDAAPPDDWSLAWWTAAAMCKIAGRRSRSLATAEWPAVPGLLARATALLDGVPGRPVAPSPAAAHDGSPAGTTVGSPAGTTVGPPAGTTVDPLDTVTMTAVLRTLPALRAAERLRVLDARLVAEAPGRRRVVRYRVADAGDGGPGELIGKIHTDRHRSTMAWENLRLLATEVFAATPGLAVAEPIGHLPALRMVLYRRVPGPTLDRVPGPAGAAAAGRWLAALHRSPVVLARRVDLLHEVAQAASWAARLDEALPVLRPPAAVLAGRLSAAAGSLPTVRESPVHKDFHAGHVVAVAGGRRVGGEPGDPPGTAPVDIATVDIAVIDLDEARMGDPALDLGHATACFDLAPWAGARAARDAFLSGYGPLAGPSPAFRTRFFAAHAYLKIAKQLATGRGPVPAAPPSLRAEAVSAALRRGLACLDG